MIGLGLKSSGYRKIKYTVFELIGSKKCIDFSSSLQNKRLKMARQVKDASSS